MTTNNAHTPDPEHAAAMKTASELIDAATKLGAELRQNRFTFKGFDLAHSCKVLASRAMDQIAGPDKATDAARREAGEGTT